MKEKLYSSSNKNFKKAEWKKIISGSFGSGLWYDKDSLFLLRFKLDNKESSPEIKVN